MPKCVKYATEEERKQARMERTRIASRRYRLNNPEKIKESHRKYYIKNIEKEKERKKLYRSNNPEKRRESEYKWRSKNPEKVKKYRIKTYIKNIEKETERRKLWVSRNRIASRAIKSKWKKNNKLAVRISYHRRRDRMTESGEQTLSMTATERIFSKFNYQCFKCGSKDMLTLDHHYPLKYGNALTESNCVILCMPCNSSKKDKLPEDFYSPEQLNILKEKYGIKESEKHNLQPSLFDFINS